MSPIKVGGLIPVSSSVHVEVSLGKVLNPECVGITKGTCGTVYVNGWMGLVCIIRRKLSAV